MSEHGENPPAQAVPEPMCDYICLKDDGHVERGEPHFMGYRLPSPQEAAVTVERLHADLAAAYTVIRRLYGISTASGVKLAATPEELAVFRKAQEAQR